MAVVVMDSVTSSSAPAIKESPTPDSLHHPLVDYIAVFLLGSMTGAIELGVKENPKGNNYFNRILTSRETWAKGVKHFYMVTGRGKEERKAFESPKCVNTTLHHSQVLGRRQEMMRCQAINVLHFDDCDSSAWGWKGPCCRAEGAIRFFLDSRNAGGAKKFPTWFLFADDDYFVRIHMLHGLLTHPRLPTVPGAGDFGASPGFADETIGGLTASPSNNNNNNTASLYLAAAVVPAPVAITSTRDMVKAHTKNGDVDRMFYAFTAPFFPSNCSVPCTHRSTWMGLAIFSAEAVKVMEAEVRLGGLQRTCRLWDVTHDVGLGLFVWEHSIPSLPSCCGARAFVERDLQDGIFFHKAGLGKDERGNPLSMHDIMDKIWAQDMASGQGRKSKDNNAVNLTQVNLREFAKGRSSFPPRGVLPSGGFKESLFYKTLVFRDVLAAQLSPQVLAKYPNSLPRRVTDYGPRACSREMDFHVAWRREHAAEFPLNEAVAVGKRDKTSQIERINSGLVGGSRDEIRMCLKYAEAVLNYPVGLNDSANQLFSTVPEDELER